MTIDDLLEQDIAFMGSDWQEDESAPADSPIPGHRYAGEILCVNCNDLFFWGSADGETITEQDMPTFEAAVEDCGGDLTVGALLWCARRRQQRPQGAYYSYFKKEHWHLFDACGPERETGFGNPYAPGQYQRERTG